MSAFDCISLDGTFLRPSPFVSTSYEYAKSGDYTIGGVLIVTLSGTLIAQELDCSDILTKMEDKRAYGRQPDSCYRLIIGCEGKPTFLEGLGKIRSATVTKGDQPCLATYSIEIAIETKPNGKDPIIDPDPKFLELYDFKISDFKGLGKYEESVSLQGDASNLALVDTELKLTKSYVKFNGKISVSALSSGKPCGSNVSAIDACINLINKRYNILMNARFSNTSPIYKKLEPYNSWSKWLDGNDLDIDASNGSVTWSFSLIMTKGACTPLALADINTTDDTDEKTQKKTRSIKGTINGLSLFTDKSLLENGIAKKERLENARKAFGAISGDVAAGAWPMQNAPKLSTPTPASKGPSVKSCGPVVGALCYQRLSSSTTISQVLGQISFSATFQDIESTKSKSNNNITYTVEEKLSVSSIVEILIPGEKQSVIQEIFPTPHTATVSVVGQLSGCDTTKITETKCLVDDMFDTLSKPYSSWLVIRKNLTQTQRSFKRSIEYMECDS